MIEGNYTPTESTLAIIQANEKVTQYGLTLYADGTCCLIGVLATYYPIGLSEIIVINNDTKNSAYVKLDDKTGQYETTFNLTVRGSAQLNDYYDFCLTHPSELKSYTGTIYEGADDLMGDVGEMHVDDKYCFIKTFGNRVYFGECTLEGNLLTLAVKDCEEDGQVTTLSALFSLDDEQQAFTVVSAD